MFGCIDLENIRIYHECEGRIEKSVPGIAVWHYEACRVMTNGDPEGQVFLPGWGGGTLIFLYIRRLGSFFFGFKILNFNIFWGFQNN